MIYYVLPGVSISTNGQRNMSGSLLIEVGYFLQKEEATSLNNGLNKKYIIESKWKRNCDLFSERPTGFTLCFSHVNTIIISVIFSKVSYRFTHNLFDVQKYVI